MTDHPIAATPMDHAARWALPAVPRGIIHCLLALLGTPGLALAADCAPQHSPTPTATLQILETLPHDPGAYTQGLIYHRGDLYESTGRYGESRLRRLNPQTGAPEQEIRLARHFFGEGLAAVDQGLWLLTWRRGIAMLYDPTSLRLKQQANYRGEGWGLAVDGDRLLMSDGSAHIQIRNPASFALKGRFLVCDQGQPVTALNELEMVEGLLWANVWQSDRIARIDPATGRVHSWLDGVALRQREPAGAEAFNGIAYNPATKAVWVTGKWWHGLYRVKPQARP